MKTIFSAAAIGAIVAFGSAAGAATLDFKAEAAGNERGVTDGTVITMDGVDVTFSSNYYAYFDHGAGLGVCRVVNNPGVSGGTGNMCNTPISNPASDDNVTATEQVTIGWSAFRDLTSVIFTAEGHGILNTAQTLLFGTDGGGLERYTFAELATATFNGIKSATFAFDDGTFAVANDRGLAMNGEQFYLRTATVSDPTGGPVVPVPASLPLLLAGVGAMGLAGRRKAKR